MIYLKLFEEFDMEGNSRKRSFQSYDDKYKRLMYRDSDWLDNGWMSNEEKSEYDNTENKSEYIKNLWNKKSDKKFFKSLLKIHWVNKIENLKNLFSISNDSELCCNGFYEGDDLKKTKTWGDVGLVLDGDVIFAGNMDLETGTGARKRLIHRTEGLSIALNQDTFLSQAELSKRAGDADIQAGNELIITNFKILRVIIKKNSTSKTNESLINETVEFCKLKNIPYEIILSDRI